MLLSKEYHGDVAFNQLKEQSFNIFEGIPKYWTSYLDMFINRNILNEEYVNFVNYIEQFSSINNFTKYANAIISAKSLISEYTQQMTVTRVTGLIHFSLDITEKFFLFLDFYVHEQLSLNITFVVLKFVNDMDDCISEGIQVSGIFYHDIKTRIAYNSFVKDKYIYCRNYAAFNLYPKFNILSIKSLQTLPFEAKIQYSVMDNGLVITKYFKDIIPQMSSAIPFHSYRFNGNYSSFSYQIKVRNKLSNTNTIFPAFTLFDCF